MKEIKDFWVFLPLGLIFLSCISTETEIATTTGKKTIQTYNKLFNRYTVEYYENGIMTKKEVYKIKNGKKEIVFSWQLTTSEIAEERKKQLNKSTATNKSGKIIDDDAK